MPQLTEPYDWDALHYYLLDGHLVTKCIRFVWYKRDRTHHTWINDNRLLGMFFDSAETWIEIDYDEINEKIIGTREIPGFSGIDEADLLHLTLEEINSQLTAHPWEVD